MGRRIRLVNRKSLLVLLFIALSFFAFQPGFRFQTNRAHWTAGEEGLSFEPYSMVYGERLFSEVGETNDFKLEMDIQPMKALRPRFGIILQVYNRVSGEELTIGQWGNSLMVLGSDDYSNGRRKPKIYSEMKGDGAERQIRVVSDDGGTSLFIDGKPAGQSAKLRLVLPEPVEKNILILGNGKNGNTPWNGLIRSVALDSQWEFDFRNRDSEAFPLLSTPARIKDLHPGFLRIPDIRSIETNLMNLDILANFIGFIPFGYLVLLNLRKSEGKGIVSVFLFACLVSFLFSLTIETAQTRISGRDSSLLDLALNTIGGVAGSLLALRKKRNEG